MVIARICSTLAVPFFRASCATDNAVYIESASIATIASESVSSINVKPRRRRRRD
jgi:hypothetical protein